MQGHDDDEVWADDRPGEAGGRHRQQKPGGVEGKDENQRREAREENAGQNLRARMAEVSLIQAAQSYFFCQRVFNKEIVYFSYFLFH